MGYRLKEGNLREATFTKPEGSQSGEVKIIFFKLGGSESGGVLYLLLLRGPNPDGFYIC